MRNSNILTFADLLAITSVKRFGVGHVTISTDGADDEEKVQEEQEARSVAEHLTLNC